MKLRLLSTSIAILLIVFTSCDDTTDTIGTSLIDNIDKLDVSADTFIVNSRTIIADSVISRSVTGYLGRVKDPESGSIINGDFMVQFNTLDNYQMPEKDSIISIQDGKIIADSCAVRLYYENFYGDSLAQMKLTAYEMKKPMEETLTYYSNFDPLAEGYVRTDGICQNRTYTLTDFTELDSIRNSSSYTSNIRIRIDQPYTDTDGNTYNNYGTYIKGKYYDDPTKFRNAYSFTHDIIPGFFFKMTGGIGSMAYINATQLYIYFRYHSSDTTYVASTSFVGTEEVLQTTTFSNDKNRLRELAEDETCTYLKSPSGLFTELTLPVDEITQGHENDTINTAKIELMRINNNISSNYSLNIPQTLLMIPADSLYSFFENNRIADNKTSYLTTYNSSRNSYTFNNISGLINALAKKKDIKEENWNKVILIPVTATYSNITSSSGATYQVLDKVTHDMTLSSTRLVGGEQNPNTPIKISIIYSKFNGR